MPRAPKAHTAPTHPSAAPRRRRWRRRLLTVLAAILTISAGVLGLSQLKPDAPNPAYPAAAAEVQAVLDAMRAHKAPVDRPVVVIAGWRAPSGSVSILAQRLRSLTGSREADFLVLSNPLGSDLNTIAASVARAVHEAFPDPDDPSRTAEVDLVGVSMGGLIGRLVCLPAEQRGQPETAPRVRVRTLYTVASPHRGTRLPRWLAPDSASRAMRPGSGALALLDAALADDDPTNNPAAIVPYAVLNDTWVGATRAAPPGQQPVWVPGRVTLSHHLASLDMRITADIARRLRHEAPLGTPSAPPRD